MRPLAKNPPAAVYRHINANGETIYIGCSINPMARFNMHRSQSPWAMDVRKIEIEWYDTQEKALAEEQRLIKAERPLHNRQAHRGKREWSNNAGVAYLSAWLESTKLTVSDLANALGEPVSLTEKLLNPRCRPQARRRVRIAAITSGFVPASCWVPYETPFYTPVTTEDAAAELENCCFLLRHWGETIPSPLHGHAFPSRQPRPGKPASKERASA